MGTFRSYQGSKNIAKKILRDRGIYLPLGKAAADPARMSAFEDAVEYATQYVRRYGKAQAEHVDLGDVVFSLFGHDRWEPVALDTYRAMAAS